MCIAFGFVGFSCCFEPVLSAAAPALGKKLNRAMRNGDMVAAAFLWEEAELDSENLQIFGLILPRLTFLLELLSRHGFNKDPAEVNEEELAMVQGIAETTIDLEKDAICRCRNLGELGTKVVAEAIATNSVTFDLYCNGNNTGDAGAQVIAESLKINITLTHLYLRNNNIGAAGAQALGEMLKINITLMELTLANNNIGSSGAQTLAESLKTNRSLQYLNLCENNISAAGAQALAAGLLQNRGLQELWLSCGSVGDEGRQALEDAEQTKKDRGEDFEIGWLS